MRKLSLPTRVKAAVLLTFGALFVPIAAEAGTAGTYASSGTVSFMLTACNPLSDAYNTSVAARSVYLLSDNLSAVANNDAATYLYFTETDTAAWGATYNYGATQDLGTCEPKGMTGTVTITRGRFMSSDLPYSETTTNVVDFIQYVGNTRITNVNGGAYKGAACGNIAASPKSPSITVSCSSGILADYTQLPQNGSVAWRDGLTTQGTNGDQSSNAYIAVKVRKGAIAGITAGASFAATETFTVTSV
jgi:hypothetical protein